MHSSSVPSKVDKADQKVASDTPLHHILRNAKSSDEINTFISKTEKNELADMAKIVNDHGELPILMIYSLPFSYQEHAALTNLLLPFTLSSNISPLASVLDAKQILKPYNHLNNTPLHLNLCLAIQAMIAARDLIHFSYTHNEVNHFPPEKRNVMKISLSIDRGVYKEKLSNESKKNKSLPLPEQNIRFMQTLIDHVSVSKQGNCAELSYATMYFVMKLNKEKTAEVWEISSNDHAIAVIDPDTPNAVICDPLNGDVFPATEILAKLTSYFSIKIVENNIQTYHNLFGNFNPQYHLLKRLFTIHMPKINEESPLYRYLEPNIINDKTINMPMINGATPLFKAIKADDEKEVEILLKLGADPNRRNIKGSTPLFTAATKNSNKFIKLLLAAKADSGIADYEGVSPLINATYANSLGSVTLLLEAKADANHANFTGCSSLFFVRESQYQKEIIMKLVEHKGQINALSALGGTPLMNSIWEKSVKLLRDFLECKADPNIVAKNGETALYIASRLGLSELVQELLKHTNKHTWNNALSPLDIAKKNKHTEVIKVLEDYLKKEKEEHGPRLA